MDDLVKLAAFGVGFAAVIHVLMKMLERSIRGAFVGLSIRIQIAKSEESTDIEIGVTDE